MTPLLMLLPLVTTQAKPFPVIPIPNTVAGGTERPFGRKGQLNIACPEPCVFESRAAMKLLKKAGFTVTLRTSKADPGLKAEGYRLTTRPGSIDIQAHDAAGVYYAVQTLRQLLPAGIERGSVKQATLGSYSIEDAPKFPWRGMLLDTSRHFFTTAEVKQDLDLLAMQKMNVFHWHLTDDGGWRIQIKKYPNLTRQGAWRVANPNPEEKKSDLWDWQKLRFPAPGSKAKKYGGFYTQEEIRDVVRYAAQRHITVVPEIEMPGHSLAVVSSYPELGCTVSDAEYKKASSMSGKNVWCAGKEKTFSFIQDVLDEVFDLFPSKVVHIGGDEVDKYLWNHCDDCQKRMKTEGLKDAEELQSYFIKRIDKYVASKGRRLMGWDEILQGGLAPNAMVMSWRGTTGGIAAAQANHDVVMTPTSHCYFDYSYSQISTDHVLSFEPVPAALTGASASHVLGGQCNLWTEWVPNQKTAQQRLFPRLLAMSEVLWSGSGSPDNFQPRLDT
ncbi:MAG: beta-N-acetylhexosaminidase, partial [Armatimonadota bacterium]